MNCRQCSKPLTQAQGRYCSYRCANLGKTVLRQRPCERCSRQLTRHQLRRHQRFCSTRCARAVQVETTPTLDKMIAILRDGRDWFWTVSDLAIWLYGTDRGRAMDAVRTLLCRARNQGYRFEQRAPVWLHWCPGMTRAYRLVSEPSAAQRRAA